MLLTLEKLFFLNNRSLNSITNLRNLLYFLVFILLNSSCKSSYGLASNNALIELEGSFKVISLNTIDVSDLGLTFTLDKTTKRVSGNSGCNTYGGNFELSETKDRISFSKIFSTKMYCVEPKKNDIEREYLSALSKNFIIIFKKEGIELEAIDNSLIKISLVKS